jgi:lipocalin-like protein
MKNYHKIHILLTAILLFSCSQEKKPKETNKLTGLWSLYIMEQKDSVTGEWKEWRNGMQGYILYDNTNNMVIHLTTKGYQNTNIRFPNFVDTISIEALKYLTNSYVYFGKYTVFKEDSTVEHARISHSNPGEWNEVVRRRYTFSGDTLILQPVEKQKAGLRLKWIRSTDSNKK